MVTKREIVPFLLSSIVSTDSLPAGPRANPKVRSSFRRPPAHAPSPTFLKPETAAFSQDRTAGVVLSPKRPPLFHRSQNCIVENSAPTVNLFGLESCPGRPPARLKTLRDLLGSGVLAKPTADDALSGRERTQCAHCGTARKGLRVAGRLNHPGSWPCGIKRASRRRR